MCLLQPLWILPTGMQRERLAKLATDRASSLPAGSQDAAGAGEAIHSKTSTRRPLQTITARTALSGRWDLLCETIWRTRKNSFRGMCQLTGSETCRAVNSYHEWQFARLSHRLLGCSLVEHKKWNKPTFCEICQA